MWRGGKRLIWLAYQISPISNEALTIGAAGTVRLKFALKRASHCAAVSTSYACWLIASAVLRLKVSSTGFPVARDTMIQLPQ